MSFSRDQLIAPAPLPVEVVPFRGGDVRLQGLTAAATDAYLASCVQQNGDQVRLDRQNIRARLLVLCIVDETGTPVLKPEDAVLIGLWSSREVEALYLVAAQLSALSPKDVEAIAKN